MNKLLLGVLGAVAFVVFLGVVSVYYAFVLSTLWTWFVVPLGVAKIGMAHAYGLSLIPSTILGTRGLYAPEDKRKEAIVTSLLFPAMSLLFGFIAVQFM